MELSPRLYHHLVRPKWFSDIYIYNLIKEHFDFQGKQTIDFGAGTGSACYLFKPGEYIGLEVDPGRVHFARHHYPAHQFELLAGDTLSFDAASIDFVLVVAVLHHICDMELETYLFEFRRILKPDGRAIIIEPCYDSARPIHNRIMTFLDNGKYIRDEHGYRSLFQKQGFNTKVLKKFSKLLYNEIFFSASPI